VSLLPADGWRKSEQPDEQRSQETLRGKAQDGVL
jgi:hypothetical protein